MKTYFIDSNVLLRFILQDNKRQVVEAEQFFEQARAGKIKLVIIPEIIFEVDYVLSGVYKIDKSELANYLLSIARTPYLDIRQRQVLMSSLEIYKKINIDLVDIFLYISAGEEKAEVFSFDKDFDKLRRFYFDALNQTNST